MSASSLGAVLPPSRAEACILLCWLGQTHSGRREFAAVPAGRWRRNLVSYNCSIIIIFFLIIFLNFLQHPLIHILICLLFLPASVLAAALCSCLGKRNAGLPHGSYSLPDGLSHQSFWRGCCSEYNHSLSLQTFLSALRITVSAFLLWVMSENLTFFCLRWWNNVGCCSSLY